MTIDSISKHLKIPGPKVRGPLKVKNLNELSESTKIRLIRQIELFREMALSEDALERNRTRLLFQRMIEGLETHLAAPSSKKAIEIISQRCNELKIPCISAYDVARRENEKGNLCTALKELQYSRNEFPLRFEHCVPNADIVRRLLKCDGSHDAIWGILQEFQVAIITKEEDSRLTQKGKRNNRINWQIDYAEAGIELVI